MSIYTTLKAATAILLALSAQGTLAAAVLDASAEGLVPRIDEAVQLRVEYCDKINFKGRCNIQRVGRGKCGTSQFFLIPFLFCQTLTFYLYLLANIKASFNDETTAIRNLDTTLGSCTWFM